MKFRATPAFKILAAFIVGVIFLAGAALLAVAGGRMYFATTAQVERLQSAQRQNVHLRALLRAAESRAADYLASPDGKALQAYRQSAAALDGGLTLLFNLLARVDDAEAAFVRVDTLVRARRSELDVATESRRESETAAAPALPVGVHADAEAAFNELDRAIEARIDAEATSRKESVGEMQRGIWLAIAVLIMLFSGAYAVVLGELKERRRLVRRLRSAATHDALTGLPNRRFFGEWLGYTIAQARRESAHVGLVFIDVDGPHEVLRLHKRPAFNALVAEIARRFRETAREAVRACCAERGRHVRLHSPRTAPARRADRPGTTPARRGSDRRIDRHRGVPERRGRYRRRDRGSGCGDVRGQAGGRQSSGVQEPRRGDLVPVDAGSAEANEPPADASLRPASATSSSINLASSGAN